MQKFLKYFPLGGLLTSTLVTGLFLSSPKIQANTSVDQAYIRVPVSCSMAGTLNSSHSAEIENGIYREDIGLTTVNVVCNDLEGFSIYAVGYSNDEYGNNLLKSSIPSSYDIVTGTEQSGNVSNWSMKLTTNSLGENGLNIQNNFDAYSPVPSSYTKVATRNSTTSVEGTSFTTTYAAYVSSTQPAGTYTGQVKYTLVHPASETPPQSQNTASGYIGYYSNTNIYEGSMGRQAISSTDTSATLLSSNFSRPGYGFAGWNTAYDYSGDFYGPNETINFNAGQYTDENEGLSLYAVWVESNGFIQDWAGCSSLQQVSYDSSTGTLSANLSNITALTDLRDNQTYAVARLSDGKCWTIENLRLSSENTAGNNETLSQGYSKSETYGNFIGLAEPESSNFSSSTQQNTIYSLSDSTTINIGTTDYPSYRFPRYNDNNISNRSTSPSANNANIYTYGNYYTWSAAMASTKYYTSGYIDNPYEENKSNLAATSLCPSGWRLPYGSVASNNEFDGDFAILDESMGGSGLANSINNVLNISMSQYWRHFPNNLVYSGNMNGSNMENNGYYGYYWTTTAFSPEKSYGLSIGEIYLNPGVDSYNKYYGFSIRCVTE